MKRHYELAPAVWHEQPLVFDWDQDTGEVSGPDAPRILALVADGLVPAHPHPWTYELGPEPTRSAADMAALVGYWHQLPEDLAAHYPQPEPEPDDAQGDDVPAAPVVF